MVTATWADKLETEVEAVSSLANWNGKGWDAGEVNWGGHDIFEIHGDWVTHLLT